MWGFGKYVAFNSRFTDVLISHINHKNELHSDFNYLVNVCTCLKSLRNINHAVVERIVRISKWTPLAYISPLSLVLVLTTKSLVIVIIVWLKCYMYTPTHMLVMCPNCICGRSYITRTMTRNIVMKCLFIWQEVVKSQYQQYKSTPMMLSAWQESCIRI